MNSKRGQVTIFVIIAIVIIAGVVLVFSLNKGSFFNSKNKDVQDVQDHVDVCLEKSLKSALFSNSIQGGYFDTPLDSVHYQSREYNLDQIIPYYLENGVDKAINRENLEVELNKAVKNNINDCLNFSQFNSEVNYSSENFIFDSSIADDSVEISAIMPLYIARNGSTSFLKDFKTLVPTLYGDYYRLALSMNEEQKNYPDSVCLSCFDSLAQNYSMEVFTNEITESSSQVNIYYLISNQSKNDPVKFYSFAHKFNLEKK